MSWWCSALVLAIMGCGNSEGPTPSVGDGRTATSAPTSTEPAWTEEELTFEVGAAELHGVLTRPASGGPSPAVVMPFESPGLGGGPPQGVSSRYQTDLARALAEAGYAAFRYDPAGIGESTGEVGFQSLQVRADETIAALHRVQEHPDVRASGVGLWGASQEAWVISVAAADHPEDVAFVIAVSGSGISVADQQVWGVEAQSRAAGLGADGIERATLVMRLLVDWQLTEPMYHDMNERALRRLGDGPWRGLFTLVYPSGPISSSDQLTGLIEILESIRDEAWAGALHLDTVLLPALLSIPPEQIDAVRVAAEQSLLLDPAAHLSRVTSPMIAFFGENDVVQPSEQSADLFARYLEAAGNDDVTIVMLSDVGHDIGLSTPGYRERMVGWLDDHVRRGR